MKEDDKTIRRVAAYSFAAIYRLYLEKVEKKGRSRAELDQVVHWLTGLDEARLEALRAEGGSLGQLFEAAPMNPRAGLITGVVCGVRVEEIENPLMQKVRWMDKLVDELAKGRKLEKVLR